MRLVGIDLDRELIASLWRIWRTSEIKFDTGDSGRGTRQVASGNRSSIRPHRLGIDFIGGIAGELDDRATTWESIVVSRRINDIGVS
ncbi:hypothetical protein D3C80_1894460 [compost metagenome]